MTLEDLNRLRFLRDEIRQLDEKAMELRARAERLTSILTGMPSGSHDHDRMAGIVAELADNACCAAAKTLELTKACEDAERWIDALPEQQQRVIDNYTSQAIKTHATGAAGAPLVDNAGGYEKGATTIHVDGLTAAFAVGDVFTLGGHQYVVTAAGELSTADQDITIYPALKASVKDNDALTVAASHTANLVFHENAFAFVTRPLAVPAGVEAYVTSYNGVTMRVVRGYNMQYKKEMLSMDVLYGYKTMYPELAVRYLG